MTVLAIIYRPAQCFLSWSPLPG